jgi:hypothetical protein
LISGAASALEAVHAAFAKQESSSQSLPENAAGN